MFSLRQSTMLLAFACAALMGRPTQATTLRYAPLSELAAHSEIIIHGQISAIDDHLATSKDGPFLTRVDIEVIEAVKGLKKDAQTFSIELPGGRAFDRQMVIPGMPRFHVGDEVVILLERSGNRLTLTGLSQGVFKVQRNKDQAIARREFGDVMLLDASGKASKDALASNRQTSLENLLSALRQSAAQGGE